MIRITDVKMHTSGMITLSCCHGTLDLINRPHVLQALEHTGIEFFGNSSTKYLREMLIGRLAKVSTDDCIQSDRYRTIIKQKRLFSFQFLKDKKEKKNGNSKRY